MALVHAETLARIGALRVQVTRLAADSAGACLFSETRVEWIERRQNEENTG